MPDNISQTERMEDVLPAAEADEQQPSQAEWLEDVPPDEEGEGDEGEQAKGIPLKGVEGDALILSQYRARDGSLYLQFRFPYVDDMNEMNDMNDAGNMDPATAAENDTPPEQPGDLQFKVRIVDLERLCHDPNEQTPRYLPAQPTLFPTQPKNRMRKPGAPRRRTIRSSN